jgi:hypothetical protein
VDLELSHETQEIRPLESERPGGTRSVTAELGERRLDQTALEL